MYNLIPAAKISTSGMKAESVRMETAANNIANVNSGRGEDGNIYQRKIVRFAEVLNGASGFGRASFGGVKVIDVVNDNRPPNELYAPNHPEADKNGMVRKPNISPIEEMVDMISATRAYEANLNVLKQSKDIAEKTINISRQA